MADTPVSKTGDFYRTGSSPVSCTICGYGGMVDTPVLGTGNVSCAGSNPVTRTIFYLFFGGHYED